MGIKVVLVDAAAVADNADDFSVDNKPAVSVHSPLAVGEMSLVTVYLQSTVSQPS